MLYIVWGLPLQFCCDDIVPWRYRLAEAILLQTFTTLQPLVAQVHCRRILTVFIWRLITVTVVWIAGIGFDGKRAAIARTAP